MKKLLSLLSLVILFLASASYINSATAQPIQDYSGTWEFSFFDASGKLDGKKAIVIAEDGTFYEKAILNIDKVIYQTEVGAIVTSSGKLKEGKLTDTDNLNNEGVLTGSFTDAEGKGEWKNYYNNSGTWTAKRLQTK